jgi:hypothetical protein
MLHDSLRLARPIKQLLQLFLHDASMGVGGMTDVGCSQLLSRMEGALFLDLPERLFSMIVSNLGGLSQNAEGTYYTSNRMSRK